jgi:carbon monoxide dehydrogenase subunit G
MTYRTAIDIDAPLERVWSVLMDVERWPEWSPAMTSVERLEPGMFRPGSTARIKQPRLPLAVWRVTELVPQKTFTWTAQARGVTTVARHTVTALEEGGTRTLGEVDQYGPLALLARIFFSRVTKRYLRQEAQGLKERCETG